jgi:cyclic pyranopterin monophosphate synthase
VSDPGGDLTHLDERGHARMVDVGHKPVQARRAVAEATVRMSAAAAGALAEGRLPKGDAAAVARVAGIMAAKRTSDLIPLCHPLPLDRAAVEVTVGPEAGTVRVEATVQTSARTGVEMEALTACTVACLTIYDMCKSADRAMEIGEVALWEKTGGRSGPYRREVPTGGRPVSANGETHGSSMSGDVVDSIDQLLGSDFNE